MSEESGNLRGPIVQGGVKTPPCTRGLIQVEVLNKVCIILRPRPFSPRSILGFGDSHNVLQTNSPNDRNDQGSTFFPRCPGSIRESFPNGPEDILVGVDNNGGLVLERLELEAEEEDRLIGHLKRVLSTHGEPSILPEQRG
jgi:hypothetical protein